MMGHMPSNVPNVGNSLSNLNGRWFVCLACKVIILCAGLGIGYDFSTTRFGFLTTGSISADGTRCQINHDTEVSLSPDQVRVTTQRLPGAGYVMPPVLFDVEVEIENKGGNVRLVELFVSEPFWNSNKPNTFFYDFQKPAEESAYSFKRIVGVRQARLNPDSNSLPNLIEDLIYHLPGNAPVSYIGNRFGGFKLGESGDTTECWFYKRRRTGKQDADGQCLYDWKECFGFRNN